MLCCSSAAVAPVATAASSKRAHAALHQAGAREQVFACLYFGGLVLFGCAMPCAGQDLLQWQLPVCECHLVVSQLCVCSLIWQIFSCCSAAMIGSIGASACPGVHCTLLFLRTTLHFSDCMLAHGPPLPHCALVCK
jgi:hypothetical protein